MTRTKHVSKEKFGGFWKKAEEDYEGMRSEFEQGRHNTAVILAVHCAISWVDSFTVRKLGKKSSSQSHGEAIVLLKEAKTSDEKTKVQVCRDFLQLIQLKTPAEYEDEILSKADAKRAIHLCEKIRSFFIKEFEQE
jgi:HEPN domain-containing protein